MRNKSPSKESHRRKNKEREELYVQLQEAQKEATFLRGEVAKKSSAEAAEAVKKQDINSERAAALSETINDLFGRIKQLEEANKQLEEAYRKSAQIAGDARTFACDARTVAVATANNLLDTKTVLLQNSFESRRNKVITRQGEVTTLFLTTDLR